MIQERSCVGVGGSTTIHHHRRAKCHGWIWLREALEAATVEGDTFYSYYKVRKIISCDAFMLYPSFPHWHPISCDRWRKGCEGEMSHPSPSVHVTGVSEFLRYYKHGGLLEGVSRTGWNWMTSFYCKLVNHNSPNDRHVVYLKASTLQKYVALHVTCKRACLNEVNSVSLQASVSFMLCTMLNGSYTVFIESLSM